MITNMEYRKLTQEEIDFLVSRDCRADDWSAVEISDPASLQYIRNVRFSAGSMSSSSFPAASGSTPACGMQPCTM